MGRQRRLNKRNNSAYLIRTNIGFRRARIWHKKI